MSDIDKRLQKLREERMAREKARIEKLREMNLKKYHTKNELQLNIPNIRAPSTSLKVTKSANVTQNKNIAVKNQEYQTGVKKNDNNNFNATRRPITAPAKNISQPDIKPKPVATIGNKINDAESKNRIKTENDAASADLADKASSMGSKIPCTTHESKSDRKSSISSFSGINAKSDKLSKLKSDSQKRDKVDHTCSTTGAIQKKVLAEITRKVTIPTFSIPHPTSRKSIAVPKISTVSDKPKAARKSMMPTLQEHVKSESVFERLYKPKYLPKTTMTDVEKLKTDPNFFKKTVKNTELILNKRHTIFEVRNTNDNIPRRSLSAVHLKRIHQNEAPNCIHKWASIGDKLNNLDIELNEDDKIREDKVTSAIRSERKKVKFMTPVPSLNTPRPEELQARLNSWLQKRGKSLDSYHHLQCFGIHLKNDFGTPKRQYMDHTLTNENINFDEENKENIACESDSDDRSYDDILDKQKETLSSGDRIDIYNWRRASFDSESVGCNESMNFNETTVTSTETGTNLDDLLIGALNDLSSLLREGFDWQQSARWLRTIRERFPDAPRTAAYWECRAALEDSRGDLPASVQCWEEAIVKGTEHSVVESNLDQLLDKFMQLKISPKSGKATIPDSKLVDVKNVFKSTIIRFAVQQAKLRQQSEQATTPVCSVTPVRRSARLSHCASRTPMRVASLRVSDATMHVHRTPVRVCDSMHQAATIAPQHVFTPNEHLVLTP